MSKGIWRRGAAQGAATTLLLFATAPLRASIRQAAATRPGPPPPCITAEMRRDDPRLNGPITLSASRLTVGDALALASGQSGVSVPAGERDGSADEAITIVCDKTPLYRVLNGIWACMSYQGALWEWHRSGAPEGYIYRLVQPEAARSLRARLRNAVQDKLERDAAILVAAADGTEEQRRTAAEQVYGDADDFARREALTVERFWTDLRAFKESLTPQQRFQVLRGATLRAPLAALDPDSRKFYHSAHVAAHGGIDDTADASAGNKAAADICFQGRRYFSSPAVSIWVSDATSGNAVLGGSYLVLDFWKRLKSLWRVPGDSDHDPAEQRVMDRLPPDTGPPAAAAAPDAPSEHADSQRHQIDALARSLLRAAESARVPLVARLPQDETTFVMELSEPDGKPLAEYWKQLWNKELMVKWHDGVQIASAMSWPNEDPPVPAWLLRALRKQAKPTKRLPLDSLTEAADLLSSAQLVRLRPEFPVMADVAQAPGLLALLRRFPDAARQAAAPDGLALARLGQKEAAALLELMPEAMQRAITEGPACRLVIRAREDEGPDHAVQELLYLLQTDDGRPVAAHRFINRPQPRKSKDEG